MARKMLNFPIPKLSVLILQTAAAGSASCPVLGRKADCPIVGDASGCPYVMKIKDCPLIKKINDCPFVKKACPMFRSNECPFFEKVFVSSFK
jgi:hypothetical protein